MGLLKSQTIYVLKDARSSEENGQFQTITEAVKSIPEDNQTLVTINIQEGIYREKLVVDRQGVTLIGEYWIYGKGGIGKMQRGGPTFPISLQKRRHRITREKRCWGKKAKEKII